MEQPPKTLDPDELDLPSLGLELGTITETLREQFQLEEDSEGVLITRVDPEGNGAEKGLSAGDLIVEVDQEAVSSPADVAERIVKAQDGGRRVVTLLVSRQGEHRWVAVRIDEG